MFVKIFKPFKLFMRWMTWLLPITASTIFLSCSVKPCKIEERTDKKMTGNERPSSDANDRSKLMYIYKPDGTLQCGQGQKLDHNEMKKQLGSIEVFAAESKHDGMMRIQVCGHPTGWCNVFQIRQSDLELATKLGFKKWIRD